MDDAVRSARVVRLSLAAEALGCPLTEAQIDQLLDYLALLERWNRSYNLTSIRDPDAMLTQHLEDCLAAVAPLQRHARGLPLKIADAGSGAGLPAVVLAIARPQWRVTSIDTVGKKVAFVRQVALELKLDRLLAVQARVESIQTQDHDVAISRAFASLGDFVVATAGLLKPGGVWAAMKGRAPEDEKAGLSIGLEVFHVEQLTIPGWDAQRSIIWMRRCDGVSSSASA